MLKFPISITHGRPIHEQIVHAVKSALAQGILKPGDQFPSVRTISQELGVNPNTVQKAVSQLSKLNILAIYPGRGSIIAEKKAYTKKEQEQALFPLLENLILEALEKGVKKEELLAFVSKTWHKNGGK